MTTAQGRLLGAFECHDPDEITAVLADGLDPCEPIDGKLPIDCLVEMYTRSDRFPQCLRLLLAAGARLPDPALEAVLLDDADRLTELLSADRTLADRRVDLACTFTPLRGAALLHVAAEYGHLAAARALLSRGADPNARAGIDAYGLGGQTPIYHTVNSNANRSLPVLRLLLEAGARCDARVDGLTWGEGFEWETVLFDLTPISYCALGSLPQFHRQEADLAANIRLMLAASDRPIPPMANIPNAYVVRG